MPVQQPTGAIRSASTGAVVDVAYSPNGQTLYAARNGTVTAYNALTGAAGTSWAVGTTLGGIDVTPDGRYLLATEQVAGPTTGAFPAISYVFYVYQLDLVTGVVRTYTSNVTSSAAGTYADIAALSDGTALLSQNYPGSGGTPLTRLDLTSGVFSNAGNISGQSATLTATADHTRVLISAQNTSLAPVYVYTTGVGITATRDGAANIFGSNTGAQAISANGNLIVEGVGLAVYNGTLELITKLSDRYFFDGGARALAFNSAGTRLYLLNASGQQVFVLDTTTWNVIAGYPVGAAMSGAAGRGDSSGYGNTLLVSPDGTHLSVIAANSVQIIDLAVILSDGGTTAGSNFQTFDTLTGDANVNYLYGFEGNDILSTRNSGGGVDYLYGGRGDDTYRIDDARVVITELPNEGTDIVFTDVSYTLPENVENITVSGAAIGTGNGGDNTMTASGAGSTLYGLGGNDYLIGGSGNDVLDGGTGADILEGRDGNDTYYIDNPGDRIVDFAGADEAIISVDYTLPDLVETLRLAGAAAINGTGNINVNRLIGNAANNILNGMAGADTLTGGLGADTLIGGTGNDTFIDTLAGLNGDTITDFTLGDRIVATDAAPGSAVTLNGNTLSFANLATVTLATVPFGYRIETSAAAEGGVAVTLVANIPLTAIPSSLRGPDFNRDGRSDVLWRNDNGALTTWSGRADGGFTTNGVSATVTNDWRIVGTGDFNGDGYGDILWRNDSGAIGNWLGSATGLAVNGALFGLNVSKSLNVAGTGDFNGDGMSDILWRNDNGQVVNWLGKLDGTFTDNSANSARTMSADWKIVGVGDFNGDKQSDILWRNDNGQLLQWITTTGGRVAENTAVAVRTVGNDWKVAGIGDFNGDGRSDILWRNDNGQVLNWLTTATGDYIDNSPASLRQMSNAWKIAGVSDYNGDFQSDILWRNDDGRTIDWLGTTTGGFVDNSATSVIAAPLDWDPVPSSSTPAIRARSDFNGDGRSDILWRNDNGLFGNWLGTITGGYADNSAASLTNVDHSWKIAGVGDFNGDGRADVLWRNADGAIGNWLANPSGKLSYNPASLTSMPLTTKVEGVGDFNGDGRSDILLRGADGVVSNSLGTIGGSFTDNGSGGLPSKAIDSSWKVAGIGDFNGDGRDDVLWRNVDGQLGNWLSNTSGGFTYNLASAATAPTAWKVAGVGDFNGDGRDDILWRNDNGGLSEWLARTDGGFTDNGAIAGATVPTSWKVAAIGDYNGDGRDDILWRNDNGAMTDWLGRIDGGFTYNDPNAFTTVSTDWQIQPRVDVIV